MGDVRPLPPAGRRHLGCDRGGVVRSAAQNLVDRWRDCSPNNDDQFRQSPPTPRKVGMPLSAFTPAPARMKTRSAGKLWAWMKAMSVKGCSQCRPFRVEWVEAPLCPFPAGLVG